MVPAVPIKEPMIAAIIKLRSSIYEVTVNAPNM